MDLQELAQKLICDEIKKGTFYEDEKNADMYKKFFKEMLHDEKVQKKIADLIDFNKIK